MIVDCDRKRDHTPVTCGVIDKVVDPEVGGVEIITCDSFCRVRVCTYVSFGTRFGPTLGRVSDHARLCECISAQVTIPAAAARCEATAPLRRGQFSMGHAPRAGCSERGRNHCGWRDSTF